MRFSKTFAPLAALALAASLSVPTALAGPAADAFTFVVPALNAGPGSGLVGVFLTNHNAAGITYSVTVEDLNAGPMDNCMLTAMTISHRAPMAVDFCGTSSNTLGTLVTLPASGTDWMQIPLNSTPRRIQIRYEIATLGAVAPAPGLLNPAPVHPTAEFYASTSSDGMVAYSQQLVRDGLR
jgi:hypothetical protein